MNNIELFKSHIKPGKPLMVLGPYGCGKLELTKCATRQLGLKEYCIHLEFNYGTFPDEYSVSFIKKIPGDGVLLFDGIQHASPVWQAEMLKSIKHPDRPVVLVGTKTPSYILADKCKIIQCNDEFPYVFKEIN